MSSGPASYDVLLVGGGPAGLSAALVLARCRRSVLLCDTGLPRNRASHAVHGLLTHDGIAPAALLEAARRDVGRYPEVTVREAEVAHISPLGRGFQAHLAGGEPVRVRRVILATGVVDQPPDVPGFDAFYGTSIHHCPICDGWEHRDRPIGVIGADAASVKLACMLTHWSRDTVLLTHGLGEIGPDEEARLTAAGVAVHRARIRALDGREGRLERVHFVDGTHLDREALFFPSHQVQRSHLFALLGCAMDESGGVEASPVSARSTVAGVHVAGDVSRDVQLVAVAIAEGAEAGCAVNASLLREDGVIP